LRLVAMKQTVSDSRLKTLVMDERSEGNGKSLRSAKDCRSVNERQ